MIFSRTKFRAASEVAFFNEIALDHLVKLLVVATIQIFPLDGGDMGPIKSIDQVWKGQGDVTLPISTEGASIKFPSL